MRLNSSSKSPSLGTLWAQIMTQWHRHKKLKCMWETENLFQLQITPFPTSICFCNIWRGGKKRHYNQAKNEWDIHWSRSIYIPSRAKTILMTKLLQNPNYSSKTSHLFTFCLRFILLMTGGRRGMHHTEMALMYSRAEKSPPKTSLPSLSPVQLCLCHVLFKS